MKKKILSYFLLFLLFFLILSLLFYSLKESFENDETTKNQTQKFFASLTTSPERIIKIEETIKSICSQEKCTKVILNLPKVFKRTGETFNDSKIPDFVLNNPKIYINFCEDLGPITKIIPVVEIPFIDSNDFIVSIDDDHIYCPMLLETYSKFAVQYPDCVINPFFYPYFEHKEPQTIMLMKNTIPEFEATNIDALFLEGFRSVLYSKKILSMIYDELVMILKNNKYCFQSDDYILSNILATYGIKIIHIESIPRNYPIAISLQYGLKDDALHKGANKTNSGGHRDNYSNCEKYLFQEGKIINNNVLMEWKKHDVQ